ncbi:hypothetical protein GOODEAATRI_030850, partial [Goodea atripinnis]
MHHGCRKMLSRRAAGGIRCAMVTAAKATVDVLFVFLKFFKTIFCTELWSQTARCSLASSTWTQQIQILSGTANIADRSRQ